MVEETRFTYSEVDWPVVYARAPTGLVAEATMAAHFAALRVFSARGACAFICEVPEGAQITALARRQAALELHKMPLSVRAVAFVSRSRLFAGVLKAVTWITPLPFAARSFTDRWEARAWIRAHLGEPEVPSIQGAS